MPERLVIGLFHSGGIADHAVHRLITEGYPRRDIARRVLKKVGAVPPTSEPELEALQVDPLVIGNARETFVGFIRNGETAVYVRIRTDEQVEFVTDVLNDHDRRRAASRATGKARSLSGTPPLVLAFSCKRGARETATSCAIRLWDVILPILTGCGLVA